VDEDIEHLVDSFEAPMSRVPNHVVETVTARAGGYCEVGGLPLGRDVELHHRKNRGSGGKGDLDTAANIIAVHSRCHRAIHARPSRSYELGWLIRSNGVPAAVPVRMVSGLCAKLK